MKPCKDCKHHEIPRGSTYSMCLNEKALRDRVSGNAFCDFERTYGHPCGLDGALLEPKPVKISWFKRVFGDPK